MSYAVVLAPAALEDLAKLPPPLQNLVEAELKRLAADPVKLSRPSHFPYIPCQMHAIDVPHDQATYYIKVLFRYSQDEQSIEIIGIAESHRQAPE